MAVVVLVASLLGLLFAGMAVYLASAPQRATRRANAVATFVQVRHYLQSHWIELTSAAVNTFGEHLVSTDTALLAKPGWIPDVPLELRQVRLVLREPRPEESFLKVKEASARYWPRDAAGSSIKGYAEAIAEFDRPGLWFDSAVYRLLGVRVDGEGGVDLDFCMARYFDALNAGEVLAYEAALHRVRGRGGFDTGPVFKKISDPFALGRRCAVAGVNTLTVRVDGRKAYFFMHRRSATGVGSAMGATHVVPAGEFQPHADVLPVWASDLDLSHTVMREYAEEFLGCADAAGGGGVTIDYAHDQPYAQMHAALHTGGMRLRVLGIGLSALTLKPEICTVCVWDAKVFDKIFAGTLERNPEGVMVLGGRRRARGGYLGLPFTADNVLGYVRDSTTLPEGQACLALAWRWRDELGIPTAFG